MEGTSVEEWSVRASAWELAALNFRYPTRELAESVASGEWVAAACEIVEGLDLRIPDGFGADLPSERVPLEDAAFDEFFRTLRIEATRLFEGPGEPACSPYEGVWQAKADGVKPLLFVNPRSMEVECFVMDCGFTRPEGSNEPLDHIATECELLEALALCAADSGQGHAAGYFSDGILLGGRSLPGGSPAAAYGRFLEDHVRAWAGDFCRTCERESRIPFYRVAARYLRFLVE